MNVREKIFVGGQWVDSTGSGSIDVINASTEEVMGRIPECTPEDVDKAVAAAKSAFDSWSQTPREIRAKYLEQLVANLAARSAEIGETISAELGMPIGLSKAIQAGLPMAVAGSYVKILDEFPFEEEVGSSLVVREPVGVVGCITPWNYPLHQVIAKVSPALAAGCTVVLKPSEVAPLTSFILAEIFEAIGLPEGVFNLVTGYGPVVGEAIAAHPDIDMVSFTGSTRAGKRVGELAAKTVKRVALELGGKSANIILDDADLEQAVSRGVGDCYLNSGQTCSALTRMLVPRSRHDEAVAIAKKTVEAVVVGDPFEATSQLGPLISDVQRERVRGYIKKGIEEGATLVTGGPDAPEGLPRGYYVKPTVFSNVRSDMTIAQEEIFGPVLSILPYDDEDDAVRIANDSVYGLGGGVWSADPERAKRVARRMRTGQVSINGGAYNPLAPFGGYKQSGHGRELGKFGLEEYLQTKSLQL
ncbi:MAG: aldehyde dehydrogenase family protein [Myxococcota bacterium]